jgi:hypothetical protein
VQHCAGGAIDEEMASAARADQDRRVNADTYDLEHVRRGRRLLAILLDRFGVAHFLERGGARVSTRACEDALAIACTWIERRTGRVVGAHVLELLRRDLKKMLRRRVAEGAACLKR